MIEKIKKNLLVVAILLGVFAVLMIFCPMTVFEITDMVELDVDLGIAGTKVIFGWEMEFIDEGYVDESYKLLEFSFGAFLAYLLPIAGIVLLCCAEKKNNKKFLYAAIVCFAVAAVLFFIAPSLMAFSSKLSKEEFEDYFSIGAGAIISGICSILSALCAWGAVIQSKEESEVKVQTE